MPAGFSIRQSAGLCPEYHTGIAGEQEDGPDGPVPSETTDDLSWGRIAGCFCNADDVAMNKASSCLARDVS
jgi:hypothetical protein